MRNTIPIFGLTTLVLAFASASAVGQATSDDEAGSPPGPELRKKSGHLMDDRDRLREPGSGPASSRKIVTNQQGKAKWTF